MVSDRMAMHILTATLDALGRNIEEYTISRSTIHRIRQKNRQHQMENHHLEFLEEVGLSFVYFWYFSLYFMFFQHLYRYKILRH